MTKGHSHRTVRIRRGSLLYRALTRPTLRVVDADRAERSRFVYGPANDPGMWRLSPLGLLHALTGLTLEVHQ